jgi:hypothetical protein
MMAGNSATRWTRERPRKSGWWWVYGEDYPCSGEVWCVLVSVDSSGKLYAEVPEMDYSDAVEDENWDDAVWMGPIEAPTPPQKLEVVR